MRAKLAALLCVLALSGCGSGNVSVGQPGRIFITLKVGTTIQKDKVKAALPLTATLSKWVENSDDKVTVITAFVSVPPWAQSRADQKKIIAKIRTLPGVLHSDMLLD